MSRSARQPRLLLVDGDAGRRATVPAALSVRFAVDTAASAEIAFGCATTRAYAVAILDATVIGGALPRTVAALRSRSRSPRLVMTVGRRDIRAQHYGATLGLDAVLGRRTPAHALLSRIAALADIAGTDAPFDRGVGRAIDLIARDVTHLVDVPGLAEATGVPLDVLSARFRTATGLGLEDYVTRVRVAVAELLLRDTDLAPTMLAELLGFGDADAMARAFTVRDVASAEAARRGWRVLTPP